MRNYKSSLEQAKGKLKLYNSLLKENSNKLETSNLYLGNLEKAQVFIQEIAKETQEQLKYHLTDIVQLALDTCFPNMYQFSIEFEVKRDKTEANLFFLKNNKLIDPMLCGGGVIDLTAFALRIASWSIGHTDKVIILDEPFKWLQPRELQLKSIELIQELSKKLSIQFIINSNTVNSEDLSSISDRLFKVSKENGISKVVEK